MSGESHQYEVKRPERQTRRREARTKKRVHGLINPAGENVSLETARETSIDQAEAREFVAKLARVYAANLEFYKTEPMGSLSHGEAVTKMEAQKARWAEDALKQVPSKVTWSQLAALGDTDLAAAVGVWSRICEAADDELESGVRAVVATGDSPTPYERAQFLAIRDAFADEWKPRGGVEAALIDMLAIAFSLQMYWTAIAHRRATQTHDKERALVQKFESQGWKSPYQSEADAVEQAHRFADGYNRQFLRTLRQMRDLRRYAPPVIVNNGGQVNVAQNQVNAQQAG